MFHKKPKKPFQSLTEGFIVAGNEVRAEPHSAFTLNSTHTKNTLTTILPRFPRGFPDIELITQTDWSTRTPYGSLELLKISGHYYFLTRIGSPPFKLLHIIEPTTLADILPHYGGEGIGKALEEGRVVVERVSPKLMADRDFEAKKRREFDTVTWRKLFSCEEEHVKEFEWEFDSWLYMILFEPEKVAKIHSRRGCRDG